MYNFYNTIFTRDPLSLTKYEWLNGLVFDLDPQTGFNKAFNPYFSNSYSSGFAGPGYDVTQQALKTTEFFNQRLKYDYSFGFNPLHFAVFLKVKLVTFNLAVTGLGGNSLTFVNGPLYFALKNPANMYPAYGGPVDAGGLLFKSQSPLTTSGSINFDFLLANENPTNYVPSSLLNTDLSFYFYFNYNRPTPNFIFNGTDYSNLITIGNTPWYPPSMGPPWVPPAGSIPGIAPIGKSYTTPPVQYYVNAPLTLGYYNPLPNICFLREFRIYSFGTLETDPTFSSSAFIEGTLNNKPKLGKSNSSSYKIKKYFLGQGAPQPQVNLTGIQIRSDQHRFYYPRPNKMRFKLSGDNNG